MTPTMIVRPLTRPRNQLARPEPRRRPYSGPRQEVLAERADLHWTYVSGVEWGVRSPGLDGAHGNITTVHCFDHFCVRSGDR